MLIMSEELAILGLLKIKAFRNKAYDVIISVFHVTFTKFYHVTQIRL